VNGDAPPEGGKVLTFGDGQQRLATPVEQAIACRSYAVPLDPAVAPDRTPSTLFMGSGDGCPVAVFFEHSRADAVAALLDSAHILYVMGSLPEAQREILGKRLAAAGFPV
jgi:hypothetical protein